MNMSSKMKANRNMDYYSSLRIEFRLMHFTLKLKKDNLSPFTSKTSAKKGKENN